MVLTRSRSLGGITACMRAISSSRAGSMDSNPRSFDSTERASSDRRLVMSQRGLSLTKKEPIKASPTRNEGDAHHETTLHLRCSHSFVGCKVDEEA